MPGIEAGEGVPSSPQADTPIGLSFESELLTIYQQEVEAHLGTIKSELDPCKKSKELIPSEEFYRALHTIHGASRTAEIGSIGELASLMEKPMKAALSQSTTLDHDAVKLFRQGYQALRAMTKELVETRQLPLVPEDLKTGLIALAEDLKHNALVIPADTDQPSGEFISTVTMMDDSPEIELDNELLAIFVDEAKELLEMSDRALHDWAEQKPGDNGQYDYSAVMELQRYLHTLKGGAKMAELNQIGDLSHELESVFIQVIDGRLEKNDSLVELLRDSFDLLHKQVDQASGNQSSSDSADQIQLLKAMRRGGGGNQAGQTSDPVPIAARRQGKHDRRASRRREDTESDSDNFTDDDDAGQERQAQEVIKVRAELLDNLVNSAGEVSIYRARMEQ